MAGMDYLKCWRCGERLWYAPETDTRGPHPTVCCIGCTRQLLRYYARQEKRISRREKKLKNIEKNKRKAQKYEISNHDSQWYMY